MSRKGRFTRLLGLGTLALAFLAGAATAQAQEATISGKVTNEQGAPVQGAVVSIASLNRTAPTNANGQYSITITGAAVDGRMIAISARKLGNQPLTKQVALTGGTHTVDFTLKADPFRLDQIIVTGVAEATSAKNLSINVAHVSEDQISEVPATNAVSALEGKVSGARISVSNGTPGSQPIIRLRGSTNLSVGGSAPLLVVDGVITTGSLADIDGNDIESIEVLKGAASANSYGSEAANGVISITTKRGKSVPDGRVAITARSEVGSGDLERYTPLSQHHQYQLNPDGSFALDKNGNRILAADHIMQNAYPAGTWRNQQKVWLRNSDFQTGYVNLGVRRGQTNFSSSYTYQGNSGILPFLTGDRVHNLRMNVDQGISDKLDMSAGITYVYNWNDASNSNPFFALLQAPPDVNLEYPNGPNDLRFNPYLPPAQAPNSRGNPLYALANTNYANVRQRVFGSFSTRYRPTSWLTLDANYGTDRTNRNITQYQFKGYLTSNGTPGNGSYLVSGLTDNAQNASANATLTHTFWSTFRSTTRFTYLYEDEGVLSLQTNTSKLVVDLPTENAADPSSVFGSSSQSTVRSRDVYGTEQFSWKDKWMGMLMTRRDGSSLFGSNNRYANFYGWSLAYRVTEDWHVPGVQELKLHVAKGTAGLRPNFGDIYQTYSLSSGRLSKSQLGNPNLVPAVQTELEYGINATFLDRFDLELTRANRVTNGAFLSIPLAISLSGGYLNQVQNAADVSGHTLELTLNTRVVDRTNFGYNLTITGDRTRQYLDRLNRPPFNRADAFGQGQGQQFWYFPGQVLGLMYGSKIVTDPKQLLDNPANKNNPNFSLDNYTVNEFGHVVLKSAYHTPAERPILYVDPKGNSTSLLIGNVNPDFNWSMIHDFRFKNWGLHVLVDGVKGGQIYNFTKQWMFQDGRSWDEDQTRLPAAARKPIEYFSATLYNGLNPVDYFVESGSYAKLRELSLNYTLSDRTRRMLHLNGFTNSIKLAVIGRNLHTWTRYGGADPETLGSNDFNFRIDGFRYPTLRTWTGQVSIGY
ncbi:MAG TPA: SusC/RagA family TonB-linked outer membrane protein [Gemmatimonadaceae bacterium]|nr:SusC/RagA family TonB-linked outer membrane protein [Gemmatimonadaceae bacterium]